MHQNRFAGFGSIVLGAGVAVAALFGPLVLGWIDFRTSAHIENQFIGGEVVSLLIVAPALIAAGVLWLRDHRLAPALAIGPAAYAVYTYFTAVIGQEYALYSGNVEKFFPLYAGLVAGGVTIVALSWTRLQRETAPELSDRVRRTLAILFLAVGGFFALAWAAQIRLVLIGEPPAEYAEGPTLFWTIKLLDFGFCIPVLIAAGTGLLLRRLVAIRAAFAIAPFATCLAAAVTGMAIAMEVVGDPAANPVMLIVTALATIGFVGITIRLFQQFINGAGGSAADPDQDIAPAGHAVPGRAPLATAGW